MQAHPSTPTDRVRIIFDTTDEIRRALKHRTNKESVRQKRDVSISDMLTRLLESILNEEIEEVRIDPAEG